MYTRSFLAVTFVVLVTGCATAPTDPIERAALAGDPSALNLLCYGYIYGREGYSQDYARALRWCKRGAESGDPNDETLYAEIYYEGHGVKKDLALARIWYRRAAEQGHEHAELMMAVSEFKTGKPDYRSFCYWLMKSKMQNYSKALDLYADMQKGWAKSHPSGSTICSDVDLSSEPPLAIE